MQPVRNPQTTFYERKRSKTAGAMSHVVVPTQTYVQKEIVEEPQSTDNETKLIEGTTEVLNLFKVLGSAFSLLCGYNFF